MKRTILICLQVIIISFCGSSQNASDALRYSVNEVFGTARNIGVGGAMAGIGADFSSISVNPSSIAAYRSSEVVLSLGVLSQSTTSILEDGGFPSTTNSSSKFKMPNIGAVFASRPKNKRTWKTSNFALGYTKVADYSLPFGYRGRTIGSITDRFVQNANGFYPEELNAFEEYLAWDTEAIYDFDSLSFTYLTDYQLSPDAPVLKSQTVTSEGSKGEFVVSYGANYNEKLLLGITLSVPTYSYEEEKSYEEEDDPVEDLVPFFNALRFDETYASKGVGFNAKFGATYKATKFLNIGAAYHTGTRFSVTDNFSTQLTYDYSVDADRYVYTSPFDAPQEGSFDYNLKTPGTFVGNLGYIIAREESVNSKSKGKKKKGRGKKKKSDKGEQFTNYYGFVVAEIQYTNYSNAEFDYTGRGNGDQFQEQQDLVNEDIKNNLSSAIQLKFGAEYPYKKLRVRAGIILTQSPYADDTSFSNTYSAGLGYRFRRVFLDFGYQFHKAEQGYSPYSVNAPSSQSFVTNNTNYNRFVFTAGYKWL